MSSVSLKAVQSVPLWRIPNLHEAIELVRQLSPSENSEGIWRGRSLSLVNILWPALALQATKDNCAVDLTLFRRLRTVFGLERFVAEFPNTREGDAVAAYLILLPGYGKNDTIANEMHGYVLMSINEKIDPESKFKIFARYLCGIFKQFKGN